MNKSEKKIYFHADDYGRTPNISKNILKCLTKGNLNSVSVIITKNNKFHKKLKKLKYVNIKLHLNLTDNPELYNHENTKLFNSLSFFKLFFLNKNEKKQVFEEIKY